MMHHLHLGKLRATLDGVLTSLWFVPAMMMSAAVALWLVGLWLDTRLGMNAPDAIPWWVYTATSDDARELVSTLLSSTITMTSLVFSVTMVVLTLAANQFGPRLIRNFMASPQTQIVLGTFMMTIVYCLLLLASVGRRHADGPLVFTSVGGALLLMVASLVLLVMFIHTLARSIVSETVIDRVGQELDDLLQELPPVGDTQQLDLPEEQLPDDIEEQAAFFGPDTAGYVQVIEFAEIVAHASKADVVVRLRFRPGDYVVQGGRGIVVYPRDHLVPELRSRIIKAITVAVHRTPVQDLEFSIRHLVEIALRALSPGTNDPYTAVAVVHRLSASLATLMRRELPAGVFRDSRNSVRVICPQPTYEGLLKGALDQIRQNGADKPLVMIHLIEAITRIGQHTCTSQQVRALREQLKTVLDAVERGILSESDKADVGKRVTKARQTLERVQLMT